MTYEQPTPVYGDVILVYQSGDEEKLANARITIEGEWLYVHGRRDDAGKWHDERHIPLARIKEIRKWDKYDWHGNFERVMALMDSGAKLSFGPVEVAKPEPES